MSSNARRADQSTTGAGVVATAARPVGRFLLHVAEMCVVMCAGGILLSVLFFQTAVWLGYANLPDTAPALSVLVIAVNLSVPMAAWMRFRGMGWRPTLEMTVPTMATGLLLVVAYWMGIVLKDSLIPIQTSLACPVMILVMLMRFGLYSAPHTAQHRHAA